MTTTVMRTPNIYMYSFRVKYGNMKISLTLRIIWEQTFGYECWVDQRSYFFTFEVAKYKISEIYRYVFFIKWDYLYVYFTIC